MNAVPRTVVGLMLVSWLLQLAGCGLGGMAASTATEAAAQAEAAKQGKLMEDKVKHDLDAAQQATKQQIDNAEQEATR